MNFRASSSSWFRTPRVGLRGLCSSVVLATLSVVGCGDDGSEEQNMLPTASAGQTDDGGDASSGDAADSSAGGELMFPTAYRFDCIDIQTLGDADGTALQATILEDTWGNDIANFKLNIVLDVLSRDDAGGAAEMAINSGIGPSAAELCKESTSASATIDVTFDPAATALELAPDDDELCSQPAADASGETGGTYEMELGPQDVVYIYAQDDDGTEFNCTPDPSPNAVPIRAIQAQVTANAAGDRMAGNLTGCLTRAEAAGLCSCLGSCQGEGPDDLQTEGECAGCPVGGTTLEALLGGVNPSTRCTELMGEEAFDLQIGFSARRLPSVPATCG